MSALTAESTLVNLTDVKAHLRIPSANTDDDGMIQSDLIPAIDDMLIQECGHTVPQQFDEYYDGGDFTITTRERPILSVELCSEGWGFVNFDLVYQQANSIPAVNLYAYSLDMPEEGRITRRTVGNSATRFVGGEGNIHVVYTAGRSVVPGAIRWAALELASHMYQGSLQRNSGTANAFDATDTESYQRNQGVASMNYGIPYRILEALKAYRRTPIMA